MTVSTTNSATSPLGQHKYLRPSELHGLRRLQFAARQRVKGAYAGRHASSRRGDSVEFTDYRQYMPGDDVSHIDWKVYGRSDKLLIKRFEHHTDMNVHLLVDGSASMAYAGELTGDSPSNGDSTPGRIAQLAQRLCKRRARPGFRNLSKYDQACLIGAAIAFLTIQQQDRAGITVAQGGLDRPTRPGGGFRHLSALMRPLEQHSPTGEADLGEALNQYAERTKDRGVLVVCSDLLEEREPILKGLTRFKHAGSDVIVFHILHQHELRLPQELSDAQFRDSETGRRLRLNISDVRQAYEQRMHEFIQGWHRDLWTRGMDYNLVTTDQPYQKALERYLVSRATTK